MGKALHYPSQPLGLLNASIDASWDSVDEANSVTGYVISLGNKSYPVVE